MLRADDLPSRGADLAEAWLQRLSEAPAVARADHLYTGRAFVTAKEAALRSGSDLGIVSAGLGFVMADTDVPAYSLTLVGGRDALQAVAPGVCWTRWWESVAASRFAVDLGQQVRQRPVTFMALTQPYAIMLAEALEGLGDAVERLRLVGLGLHRIVPSAVRRSILPYDSRAEALLSGGTRGEFAARATAFHLAQWSGREWHLGRERRHVEGLVAGQTPPTAPSRRRVCDTEILAAVGTQAPCQSTAAALRRLRRLGIACGSERLGRLMGEEKGEAA